MMIELNESNIKLFEQHSSKGNQLKWEKDDLWYKADYTGYEGLAEYIVSRAFMKSSLGSDEFVIYELEQIKYKRTILNGVKSNNFLEDDWQIITLQRLYQTKYNRNLMEDIWHIQSVEERVIFLVQRVEELTKIQGFGEYLSKMLAIDALFLNEDRHMHNIAVCMNTKGEFKLCPFFDHGASLLADITLDYPLEDNVYDLINDVKAKTICQNFDEALDTVEKLYGQKIHFNYTSYDINMWLEDAENYSDKIKDRVKDILCSQMKKYGYMFGL